MRYGTSYFPSQQDAVKYYTTQGYSVYYVIRMIKEGSIHIGMPPGLNSLRRAVLHKDQGGSQRYFIHEDIRIG